MPCGSAGAAFRSERVPPRDHLVEDEPERVDVGARVDANALDLLGRHVRRGADDAHAIGAVQAVAGELAGAEIEHFDDVVVGDEDVFGLEIAVDDVDLVHGVDAVRDFRSVVQRVGDRQTPGAIEHVAQRLAVEPLHGKPDHPRVGDARVVDLHEIFVLKLGEHHGLHLHASARVFLVAMADLEAFDCHGATARVVDGFVHVAHPPRRDEGENAVAVTHVAREKLVLRPGGTLRHWGRLRYTRARHRTNHIASPAATAKNAAALKTTPRREIGPGKTRAFPPEDPGPDSPAILRRPNLRWG